MPKIFISYRRADSQYVTDAIYSEMGKHFGEHIFLDVDDIPPGVDFPEFLAAQIAQADAVLVIIGQDWARIMEERANEFNDFVRIEIESALQQGKLVIPVLVKNAKMPDFNNLPESIRDLQRKNAVPVRRHPDMRRDCERLAKGIERAINHNRQQIQRPVGTTSMSSETPQKPISTSSISKPKFILPDLHWIDIPAGKVTIEGAKFSYIPEGQKQTFDVPAFAIAKYPVTNKLYAEYVAESGKEPEIWYHESDPMIPISGVSWYEAIAFCEWLSEKSGLKINLPTELQWQRAAQGDDGRLYPWGNQWDASRCNHNFDKRKFGRPSPVTAYEGKGDSPYGIVDMSGNVWEWCMTAWGSGSNEVIDPNQFIQRVYRGGSWGSKDSKFFRVSYRGKVYSRKIYSDVGFRVSRSYE